MKSNRIEALSFFILVYSLLLNTIQITATGCVDTPGSIVIPGQASTSTCIWVAEKSHQRCVLPTVKEKCPFSCDANCLKPPYGCRDSTVKFVANVVNGKPKSCAWLNRKKTEKRCGKWPNVRKYCPFTCKMCGNEPSAAPSLSQQPSTTPSVKPSQQPSTTPSVKPSVAPSLPQPSTTPSVKPSSMPSNTHSEEPSSMPSFICENISARFYVYGQRRFRSCKWASNRKTQSRCRHAEIGVNCPRLCGNCIDSPSASPSVSRFPSKTPSILPSNYPSKTPSDTPSQVPSTGPSSQPSLAPSDAPSRNPSQSPSDTPSQVPSKEPSSTPSACQDETNWAITVGGTQITCAGMSNQQWCNDYNAHVGTNDKTNEQACCNCGGSLFESSPPSTSPSQVPSQQPSACLDVSAWVSVDGNYNCASYNSNNCGIVKYDTSGVSNQQACCGCNGGQHKVN